MASRGELIDFDIVTLYRPEVVHSTARKGVILGIENLVRRAGRGAQAE